MTVLFVADICGKVGRQAASFIIKSLKEEHNIDYVIANIENAAGGFGVTPEMSRKAFGYGINVQTSGNHIWDRYEIIQYIQKEPRLLRPNNYPSGVPGNGTYLDIVGDKKVATINVMGRAFLKDIDCPFESAFKAVERLRSETKIIIVDMHAEATAEKQAMLYYLDGKISALIGTHTHVQTADETITEKGTAFISDVGMTGPHDSVIGMEKDPSLARFLTGMPKRMSTASGDIKLSGVLLKIDDSSGICESIERLKIDFDPGNLPVSNNHEE